MRQALVALLLAGCVSTGDGGLDLQRVHGHLDGAERLLADFVAINGETDPEFAADLQSIQTAVAAFDAVVEQALVGGATEADLYASLELVFNSIGPLLSVVIEDPEKQARVRTVAALLRFAFDQVRLELDN